MGHLIGRFDRGRFDRGQFDRVSSLIGSSLIGFDRGFDRFDRV